MKKYFKKIFSLIVVLMLSVILTGCANIEYYRVVDGYGFIMEKLVIDIDKEALKNTYPTNTNQAINNLKSELETDFKTFEEKINKWKQDNFGAYTKLYSELVTDITIDKSVIIQNGGDIHATLTLGFKNEKMFYIFYGVAEITDENGDIVSYSPALNDYGPFLADFENVKEENDGFFTYKYDVRNSNTIADALDKDNGDEYYLGFVDKYGQYFFNTYDINDVLLYQVFGYPDDKLHSNADMEGQEGGINLFKWKIDITADTELELYKLAANRHLWYIVAIAVALVSVMIISFNIKKNGSKEEVKKVSNENDIVDED
ncbi:MAG: hypothetical protein IJW28_01410 [Clostridia bacterium]|nr:hypothetical protein [Clostridia bacterium]